MALGRSLFLLVALAGWAQAQTVATDPVGAITLTLKGNSDTFISLPFNRPVALETTVQNVSGNTINIAGSANLTPGQFVYAAGTQSNTYYVQFTSGARAGMYYTVTANGASSITIDPNGDAGFSGNVSTSDGFRVIPYWTLNTLFPSGQGINGSPSFGLGSRNTQLLFPDNSTPGINRSPSSSYFYYNGTANGGAGWRQASALVTTLFNDTILYPDNFFIVRNNIAGDTSLVLVGAVPMSPLATPIATSGNNVDQDIFIGLPVPANVTLVGSNLFQSGTFTGSSSFSLPARQDQLLVFDDTSALQNRSPSTIYFYYTGSSNGGPGWRKASDLVTNIVDTAAIFVPGKGYILRKKGTATPQTSIWTFTPSYLTP